MKLLIATIALVFSTAIQAETIASRFDVEDERFIIETTLSSEPGPSEVCHEGSYLATYVVTQVATRQEALYAIGCWAYMPNDKVVAVAVHPTSGAEPYMATYQTGQFKTSLKFRDWAEFNF